MKQLSTHTIGLAVAKTKLYSVESSWRCFDPDALGDKEKVNSYCGKVMEFCSEKMVGPCNNSTNVSFAGP